jgi:Zn-dependent protease with chaperone function
MSFIETLCLVLAALYALTCVLLCLGVAVIWHAGLRRRWLSAGELLALRLLPSLGAAFLTITVTLPAFLVHEPHRQTEPVGYLLVLLALCALVAVGSGVLRGCRAWAATRTLLRRCGPGDRRQVGAGRTVHIVEFPEPLAAVVGGWRPRILAADRVRAALSDEEFEQVIAHEAAHVAAHDNVKLLLQTISPDALAWLPAGTALTQRWRAAAELEADARAGGFDRAKRLALASALIKVARLSSATERRPLALLMPVAVDDIQGRVRGLLAPLPMPPRRFAVKTLIACSLILAIITVPLHGIVHEFIESLVGLGTR